MSLVLVKLNHFEAKHVSNILWALACLGPESLHVQVGSSTGFHVVEALLMHAIRIIAAFIPQSIAQMAYALARLQVTGAREFMPLLAVVSKAQLDGFTFQDISVLMYSMASLQYEDHVDLLGPLLNRIDATLHKMEVPQQMANIMWALPKLVRSRTESLVPLLEKAQQWTALHMNAFKSMEIASYMQSMAQLRFLPSDALLHRLDHYCSENFGDLAPVEVATILVACADFNFSCPSLLTGLERIEDYQSTRDIPTTTILILWALAMLDEMTIPRVQWAAQYLNNDALKALPSERRMQFGQVLVTFRLTFPDSNPDDIFPSNLVQGCWELWSAEQVMTKIPSLMRSYFYALQRLGYHCEAKRLERTKIGTCTAQHPCGHHLAIEVDVQRRRFINASHKRLGRVLWRKRVLEAEGWTVLRINRDQFPHYDVSEQILYIQDQLDQLMSPSSNDMDVMAKT